MNTSFPQELPFPCRPQAEQGWARTGAMPTMRTSLLNTAPTMLMACLTSRERSAALLASPASAKSDATEMASRASCCGSPSKAKGKPLSTSTFPAAERASNHKSRRLAPSKKHSASCRLRRLGCEVPSFRCDFSRLLSGAGLRPRLKLLRLWGRRLGLPLGLEALEALLQEALRFLLLLLLLCTPRFKGERPCPSSPLSTPSPR